MNARLRLTTSRDMKLRNYDRMHKQVSIFVKCQSTTNYFGCLRSKLFSFSNKCLYFREDSGFSKTFLFRLFRELCWELQLSGLGDIWSWTDGEEYVCTWKGNFRCSITWWWVSSGTAHHQCTFSDSWSLRYLVRYAWSTNSFETIVGGISRRNFRYSWSTMSASEVSSPRLSFLREFCRLISSESILANASSSTASQK